MKEVETIHWERTATVGFALGPFSRTHLRYLGSTRTVCRMPIPEQAVLTEGEPECMRCQEMRNHKPSKMLPKNRMRVPTQADIAKAVAKFLKDGGQIKKIVPGESVASIKESNR